MHLIMRSQSQEPVILLIFVCTHKLWASETDCTGKKTAPKQPAFNIKQDISFRNSDPCTIRRLNDRV